MFPVAQVPVKTLALPQMVVRMLVVPGGGQYCLKTGFLAMWGGLLPWGLRNSMMTQP